MQRHVSLVPTENCGITRSATNAVMALKLACFGDTAHKMTARALMLAWVM